MIKFKLLLSFVMLVAVSVWVAGQLSPSGIDYLSVLKLERAEAKQTTPEPIPSYCAGHEDICGSLRKAGFPEDQVRIMMAIAGAESNYRLDARGDVGLMDSVWRESWGTFQIRCLWNPGNHWERNKDNVMASLDNQAKAAYIISGSGKGNFWPWSTYQNKDSKGNPIIPKYVAYLDGKKP